MGLHHANSTPATASPAGRQPIDSGTLRCREGRAHGEVERCSRPDAPLRRM
jgi:hypothetical protein